MAKTQKSDIEPAPNHITQAKQELLARQEARVSLSGFSKYVMQEYRENWHHKLICDFIHRMLLARSNPHAIRRLLVSVPPRTGKSQLISRHLPAFLLGLNPKHQIIATTYNQTFASKIARDVKRIMESDEYKRIFGTRIPSSSGNKNLGKYKNAADFFELQEGGYYKASGFGGAITGMGANWLIVDDPYKNREEADSLSTRNSISEWYKSVLRTRAEKDARIIIIQTRWHPEDLVGEMIDIAGSDLGADQWECITLPAIAEVPLSYYDSRKVGESLWVDKFTEADYQQIKLSIGNREWQSLYQQNPQHAGTNEWNPSLFPETIMEDNLPSLDQRTGTVIALDPSIGAGTKNGDFAGIVCIARGLDQLLHVDSIVDRMSIENMLQTTVEFAKKCDAEAITVEANLFQSLLVNQLSDKLRASGVQIPVIPLKNNINKEVRIRRLGPYIEKGHFRFVKSRGNAELLKQLKQFPVGSHDDGPDALEQCLRILIAVCNNRARKFYGSIV